MLTQPCRRLVNKANPSIVHFNWRHVSQPHDLSTSAAYYLTWGAHLDGARLFRGLPFAILFHAKAGSQSKETWGECPGEPHQRNFTIASLVCFGCSSSIQ